jgi:hypothetical protein
MPNGRKGGLDRRDFMALALGSVGATAAVSINADAAKAQDATVSSAAPLTGVQQGRVYTGDVIQGRKLSARSMSTTWKPASISSISKGCKCRQGRTGMCP